MHFDCSAHHNNRDVLCFSTFIYSITNLGMITGCEQHIDRKEGPLKCRSRYLTSVYRIIRLGKRDESLSFLQICLNKEVKP